MGVVIGEVVEERRVLADSAGVELVVGVVTDGLCRSQLGISGLGRLRFLTEGVKRLITVISCWD